MKKTISLVLFPGIFFTACENKSDNQEGTESENTTGIKANSESGEEVKNDSKKGPDTDNYLYKSDNGEILDVTFFEENDKMYLKIKRDLQAGLILEQTTASAKGAEYEKENYKWISQNGEATYSDGKTIIKLTVISPLQYSYTDGNEDITIIYFSKDDKRFVTVKKDNEPEITLEQTTAWAKGAEYGKGPVQWHSQRNTGTLIEDGTKTEFKEKK